jgi:hypothetical protein
VEFLLLVALVVLAVEAKDQIHKGVQVQLLVQVFLIQAAVVVVVMIIELVALAVQELLL